MTIEQVYDAIIWLADQCEGNYEFVKANREEIQNIIDCANDVPARMIAGIASQSL